MKEENVDAQFPLSSFRCTCDFLEVRFYLHVLCVMIKQSLFLEKVFKRIKRAKTKSFFCLGKRRSGRRRLGVR